MDISATSVSVSPEGGSVTLTFTSSLAWETNTTADWIVISPASGAAGENVTLTVSASANESGESRSAVVNISLPGADLSRQVTVTQASMAAPYVSASVAALQFPASGGETTLTVSANVAWTLAPDAEWIQVSPAQGAEGSTEVKVSLAENPVPAARSGKLVLSGEAVQAVEISVSQEAAGALLTLSSNEGWVDSEGGSVQLTVTANLPWTAQADSDWVTVAPAEGEAGTSEVTLTVDEYGDLESRSAVISFKAEGAEATYQLVQSAAEPYLVLTAVSETELGPDAAAVTLKLSTNTPWQVSADADWLSLSPSEGQPGEHEILVSVAQNTLVALRQGTVTAAGAGLEASVVISQTEAPVSLELSATDILTDADAVTKDLSVASNFAWTATTEADWITVTPAQGEAGETAVQIIIAENTLTAAREDKVIFTAGEVSQVFSVIQMGVGPSLVISESSIPFTAAGGEKAINLHSNMAWTATADADWISVSPASGDAGEFSLTLAAAENTLAESRSGSVTFTVEGASVSLEITQEGASASLTLSQESLEVPAEGGTYQLSLNSNLAWTATADADWVSISPAEGEAGESEFAVTVVENAFGDDRLANVSFTAGDLVKVLLVGQEGVEPYINLSATSGTATVDGGTLSITVSANVLWTASTEASWVSVAPQSAEPGETTLSFTVAANEIADRRTAVINFTSADGETAAQYSLTQDAAPVSFSVAGPSEDLLPAAGTFSITVTANLYWELSLGDATWIAYDVYSGGPGTTTVTFTYKQNDSESPRDVQLRFTYVNEQFTHTVTQLGKSAVGSFTGTITDWENEDVDFNKNN